MSDSGLFKFLEFCWKVAGNLRSQGLGEDSADMYKEVVLTGQYIVGVAKSESHPLLQETIRAHNDVIELYVTAVDEMKAEGILADGYDLGIFLTAEEVPEGWTDEEG